MSKDNDLSDHTRSDKARLDHYGILVPAKPSLQWYIPRQRRHSSRGFGAATRKDAHSMRDDLSVTDLVTSARNGDKQAWDGLVERYAPLIWSICGRYRLCESDAEDVGQTVWMHLVEHLHNLRDPAALPGWLATTTRRECWRVRRAMCTLPADGQVLEYMPDEQAETAEHALLVAERNAALREAFANLPLHCQRLLALLIADPPVPYAEISARLGIPVGSIGPYRHRYLDMLRRDPAIVRLINAEAVVGR
jgi:RNA polymerase sigma factor (sigma-70 family)